MQNFSDQGKKLTVISRRDNDVDSLCTKMTVPMATESFNLKIATAAVGLGRIDFAGRKKSASQLRVGFEVESVSLHVTWPTLLKCSAK